MFEITGWYVRDGWSVFEVKGRTKVDASGVSTAMLSFGERLAA